MNLGLLYEPGFYVLAALPLALAIQAIATWAIRPRRRELLELVHKLTADPKCTKADKAWIEIELETATNWWFLWIMALFSPVIFVGAMCAALWDAFRHGGENEKARHARHEAEHTRINAIIVRDRYDLDPSEGIFWKSEQHEKIADLAHELESRSNPIAMGIIIIWLAIGLPIVSAIYGVSSLFHGSMQSPAILAWEGVAIIADRLRLARRALT